MKITLAYADTGRQSSIGLDIPEGATLGDALEKAVLPADVRDHLDAGAVGVWGKVRPLEYKLREGDRIELYRPLVADPKAARRKRAATR